MDGSKDETTIKKKVKINHLFIFQRLYINDINRLRNIYKKSNAIQPTIWWRSFSHKKYLEGNGTQCSSWLLVTIPKSGKFHETIVSSKFS